MSRRLRGKVGLSVHQRNGCVDVVCVRHGRTGRDVGKIQQGHKVYPEWLRHRVSPPKRESMPFFLRLSTPA